MKNQMTPLRHKIRMAPGALVIKVVLFLFFMTSTTFGSPSFQEPFSWNHDQLWRKLEQQFVQARTQPDAQLKSDIKTHLDELASLIKHADTHPLSPEHPLWDKAETVMLSAAPLLAACPDDMQRFVDTIQDLQRVVKNQAAAWPADSFGVRQRLYRLVYGGRTVIEQIMLQTASQVQSGLTVQTSESSAAPSIKVKGVILHSGDILVSRGGAATSALIARGNDFPGNFSHVALLYVDAETGEPAIIEALIEKGVVVSSAEKYLADPKMRIMVLRPRADLPQMRQNPMLAHDAARWAYQQTRRNHFVYDFEMDFQDHQKYFCAEVVYAAYEQMGIRLWRGLSHISADGTANWLAEFGVRCFETIVPSDLEYDPQLSVVAEWRDPKTLFKDQLDNAVTDILLERANNGADLNYNHFLLPLAGILKVYSVAKNRLGAIGPIPEGMGVTAALRNRWYTRKHGRMASALTIQARQFEERKGYVPPYWELVRMARKLK